MRVDLTGQQRLELFNTHLKRLVLKEKGKSQTINTKACFFVEMVVKSSKKIAWILNSTITQKCKILF